MSNAILLDTDVLVRLLHTEDPLHLTARNSLRDLRRQQKTLFTAVQNVAEFWNVCTRPASARNGLGFEPSDVEKRLVMINRWCRVLTESESSYAIWQRLVANHAVRGVAVHDARLVSVMLANGISNLLTFNGSDFKRYEPEGVLAVAPSSPP
jgi:predicted nucleic acid-binding protein